MDFERKVEWVIRQRDVGDLENTLNELSQGGYDIHRIDSPTVQTDQYVVIGVRYTTVINSGLDPLFGIDIASQERYNAATAKGEAEMTYEQRVRKEADERRSVG